MAGKPKVSLETPSTGLSVRVPSTPTATPTGTTSPSSPTYSGCKNFKDHAFKKGICANCSKPKSDHDPTTLSLLPSPTPTTPPLSTGGPPNITPRGGSTRIADLASKALIPPGGPGGLPNSPSNAPPKQTQPRPSKLNMGAMGALNSALAKGLPMMMPGIKLPPSPQKNVEDMSESEKEEAKKREAEEEEERKRKEEEKKRKEEQEKERKRIEEERKQKEEEERKRQEEERRKKELEDKEKELQRMKEKGKQ